MFSKIVLCVANFIKNNKLLVPMLKIFKIMYNIKFGGKAINGYFSNMVSIVYNIFLEYG